MLNDEASAGYDLSCDASKFMSMDVTVPQLYTIGADGTTYAINERPLSDGRVRLGLYLPQDGAYTLSLKHTHSAPTVAANRTTNISRIGRKLPILSSENPEAADWA